MKKKHYKYCLLICLFLVFITNNADANKMYYKHYKLEKSKSFAEQVKISNAIYEICYDFDLQNTSVEMPKDCLLRFNGGMLSNGRIKGNNTIIEGKEDKIFTENLILDGLWSSDELHPKWFGASGDGQSDDSKAITKMFSLNLPVNGRNNTYSLKGIFHITSTIKNCKFNCSGETKFYVDGEYVKIDNCIFEANNHSVDRSLIECVGSQVFIQDCIVENIHSTNGSGAYGIFINIERCSSSIMHCKFRNISDARETVDPIGVIKGMCGGVFYSGTSSALTTTPCMQVLDGVELENIYTSQPNGEINNVSTDADGIRVFVNDARTETKFYNAQSYSFSNIIGRDIQKRILKLSGVTNCKIENVTYEGNKKLPQRFPLSLIAVMDAFDVSVKSVRNISGCMKIGFVILNSKNIQLESFFLSGNGKDYNNSKAWLFRVFNSNNLRIENVKFEGNFEQLGRVYDSKDVYLQFDGHDFNTGNSLDVKRSDSVVVNCTLRNVGPGRTPLMFFDNMKDVKVNCNQKNVYSRIVDLGAYNNVDVLVNEESND